MPTGKPQYQLDARKRMKRAQIVAKLLDQPAAVGAADAPSPRRPRFTDPREGELRSQRVAQTGPRKGSTFTEIVRGGRVFHKYGDDVGAGLGPEVVEVKKPGLAQKLVGNHPAAHQGPGPERVNDDLARLAAEKAKLNREIQPQQGSAVPMPAAQIPGILQQWQQAMNRRRRPR